jgi:hypothetical protein
LGRIEDFDIRRPAPTLQKALDHLIFRLRKRHGKLRNPGRRIGADVATDGYFILSTLFKTPNARTNAFAQLQAWRRGKWTTVSRFVFVYAAGSIVMILLFFIQMIRQTVYAISDIAAHGPRFSAGARLAPVVFFLLITLLQWVKGGAANPMQRRPWQASAKREVWSQPGRWDRAFASVLIRQRLAAARLKTCFAFNSPPRLRHS